MRLHCHDLDYDAQFHFCAEGRFESDACLLHARHSVWNTFPVNENGEWMQIFQLISSIESREN